jgi:anthranilate phosphoribosyltransferase
VVIGKSDDLAAGVALACEVIDDGRAEQVLAELIRVSQSAVESE